MSDKTTATVSHIGVCTSDVERSVRFYVEALGFELVRSIDEIGEPFDKLTELPGARFSAHYVQNGNLVLELLGYHDGKVVGPAERRPMNQLGFTHLTLMVEDIDAVVERVEQFGGKVHPETRVDSPFGPMVFCTDPDGLRIELMRLTE